MSNLTFIPAHVSNDIELMAWMEEQMARVSYDNDQWLQDQDEEFTEAYL